MKKMALLFLAFAAIAFAGEFYCNDGSSASHGIPETSCVATSSNFIFGITQDYRESTNIYFVDLYDISFTLGTEQNVPLRLMVYSNESSFNAIQAITQTAFATNASLQIIFKNPELSQNYTAIGTNGRNLCYRYGGPGSSVVCHIDAITIQR